MAATIDLDVFSRILSHIPDSKTVYVVLGAIPQSHDFFGVALHCLLEFPVYLDTFNSRSAAASKDVLELLASGGDSVWIADLVRNLVCSVEHNKYRTQKRVDVEDDEEEPDMEGAVARTGEAEQDTEEEHESDEGTEEADVDNASTESEEDEDVDVASFHERLPHLFKQLHNLKSIDYRSRTGLPLSPPAIEALAACERLQTFSVDTAFPKKYMSWAESWDDPETWDIEPFLSSLGPSITSLELRNICQTMFLKLISYGDIFSTYERLSTLKLNITEGVWDWDGYGSPNSGATGDYIFPSLRIPALRRYELVVGDLTITKPRTSGSPLHLVDCTYLSELTLIIRQCNWYWFEDTIELFGALRASDFPALAHIEIKDINEKANERLDWGFSLGVPEDDRLERGRAFPGLISFLSGLPSLVSVWVDERVLLPKESSAGVFFSGGSEPEQQRLASIVKDVLWRLESLRVGFGVMTLSEVEHVLNACDPAKLRQFGFEWAWHSFGHEEPISPALLVLLARFPKLTDVHILFPRPGTQVSGLPDPAIDALTQADVAAIFACNGNISRVGLGNSVVWERHGTSGIILVSDGSFAPNAGVSPFYHVGYMAKYEEVHKFADNMWPLRPERSGEIEQLRDLLKSILDT